MTSNDPNVEMDEDDGLPGRCVKSSLVARQLQRFQPEPVSWRALNRTLPAGSEEDSSGRGSPQPCICRC